MSDRELDPQSETDEQPTVPSNEAEAQATVGEDAAEPTTTVEPSAVDEVEEVEPEADSLNEPAELSPTVAEEPEAPAVAEPADTPEAPEGSEVLEAGAATPVPGDAPETEEPVPALVDDEVEPAEPEPDEPVPAEPADKVARPAQVPTAREEDRVSREMWAAVRNRDTVLTGEEVRLGASSDTEEIIGDPARTVDETETEIPTSPGRLVVPPLGRPATLGTPSTATEGGAHEDESTTSHATSDKTLDTHSTTSTTIPAVKPSDPSTEVEEAAASATMDILDRRTAEGDEAEEAEDAVEDTVVRRRSLMTPAAPETEEEAAAWRPRAEETETERAMTDSTPTSLGDALFEGASLVPEMPSRTTAHIWSLVLALLLVPAGWFLAAEAGARMALDPAGPATTGALNYVALLELGGALLAGAIVVLATMRSSLGAWLSGIVLVVLGLPWIIIPGLTRTWMEPSLTWLTNWNVVGANLAHHLQLAGYTGRLFLLGLAVLAMGMIARSVRRAGRKEEALRAEVETRNPAGAHFTALARRRAEKAAGLR